MRARYGIGEQMYGRTQKDVMRETSHGEIGARTFFILANQVQGGPNRTGICISSILIGIHEEHQRMRDNLGSLSCDLLN